MITARGALRLIKDTVFDFIDGDASMLAAALSFFAMLALSPLLIVVVAIASPLYGREDLRREVVARVYARVGEQAAGLIDTVFEHLRTQEDSFFATIIGVFLILYTATRLFVHLRESLNNLWGIPKPAPMPLLQQIKVFLHQRLLSTLMLLVIGVLIVATLILPAVLTGIEGWLGFTLPGGAGLWLLGRRLLTFGLLAVFIAVLYKVLPDVRMEWRDVWIGAAGTSLLFVVAQVLIGLYFRRGSPGSPYGTAGSMFVLFLWVYYQAQVFFLGAHFTHRYKMMRAASIQRAAQLKQHEIQINERTAHNAPQPTQSGVTDEERSASGGAARLPSVPIESLSS